MLTKISTDGFKNQNLSVGLGGLDLFTSQGKNGVGKSTCLEIALLLALGYVPSGGDGNTVDSVLKYSTKKEIVVSGEFQNGSSHKIVRKYLRNGLNKRKININGEEFPYKEGNEKIQNLFGSQPMMFDITDFLNMSEAKKKDFILQFSPEGISWTKQDVFFLCRIKLLSSILEEGVLAGLIAGIAGKRALKELSAAETDKLEVSLNSLLTEEHKEAVDDLVDAISPKWNNEIDSQQNISNIVDFLKKEKLKLDRKIRESKAGKRKILQTGQENTESVAGSISEVKKTLETLQLELTKVEKQKSADIEKIKAVEKRDKRRNEILSKLSSFKNRNWSKIDELNRALKEPDPELLTQKESLKTKQKEFENISEKIARVGLKIEELKTNIAMIETSGSKRCLIAGISCDQDFSSLLKNLKENLTQLQKESGKLAELKTSANLIVETKRDNVFKAEKEIVRKGSELKLLKERKRRDDNDFADLTKELEILKKEESEDIGLADPELLEVKKNGLKSHIGSKKHELSNLEQIKAYLVAEKEIKIGQLKDQKNLSLVKEAIKILGPAGLQGEIVAAVKKPLEDEVNNILHELNPFMTFAIDLADGFKIGWLASDGLRLFSTLNQAHYVILVIAFLTAVINRINPPLKMLCVEAAEVGPENMLLLLEGLAKIKKLKKLDNILIAHYQTISEEIPGCRQHILGKTNEA